MYHEDETIMREAQLRNSMNTVRHSAELLHPARPEDDHGTSKETRLARVGPLGPGNPVYPTIAALPDAHTGGVIDFSRKHPSPIEIAITESCTETLLGSLATRKSTETAVTNTFLRRAAIAQKMMSNAGGCARPNPSKFEF
ncbi:hypothetical protein N7457_009754 [Penicillium paradoxum]|uniref:uncharacterized protein n=1 Tax=Penicillium paradoxum TaxID=176176 RepID=UPI002548DEA4|nr:uncharacterized protein N7457_009754 [Penicillium paradoxum]KAJ5774858.1 hypothetical protein N7457_009754 [Penicillium paradoxum]